MYCAVLFFSCSNRGIIRRCDDWSAFMALIAEIPSQERHGDFFFVELEAECMKMYADDLYDYCLDNCAVHYTR